MRSRSSCPDSAGACTAAPPRSCARLPARVARSAPASPSPAPPRAEPVRSPLFSQHLTGHLVFQEGLREQLLESGVLRLELLQPLRVRHSHAAKLASPRVVARLGEPVLAAEVLHRQPGIGLPQETHDLPFREPLLHRPPLFARAGL